MTDVCPTCGQPLLDSAPKLTARELDALSAWWATGTTAAAAELLGLSPQTVKNQLYSARQRHGFHRTIELIHAYLQELRSPIVLREERLRKVA